MRYPISKALVVSLPLWLILLIVAAWNPCGKFWGSVEEPKAQCEAYDAARLKTMPVLSAEIYDREKLDRLIREPQNTISNLPYAVVGLAVFFAARRPLSRGWAIGCVFLGFGSGMYHAALLPEWRLIDILGVYVALFGLTAIALSAQVSKPMKLSYEAAMTSVFWIIAFWTGIHRNDVRVGRFKLFDSTYVVVAAVAFSSILALRSFVRTADKRRSVFSLAALVIAAPLAFAGGLGDRFGGFLADPEGLIQGHSIWHACGAIALLASYEIFAAAGHDRSTFSEQNPGT